MSAAISTALQLALAHPAAMLACPSCGALTKAENIERHLAKTHPLDASSAVDESVLRLVGRDGRVVRPLLALNVLWAVGFMLLAALHVSLTDGLMVVLGVTFLACFGSLGLALLGVFPARLELYADRVCLRWGLGLGTGVIWLPAQLSAGRTRETRTVAGSHQYESAPGEDVDAGPYLQLTNDARNLIVGCASGAGLQKRWVEDGWHRGPTLRRRDITLDRRGMLAVEYHLARLGMLRPFTSSAAAPSRSPP